MPTPQSMFDQFAAQYKKEQQWMQGRTWHQIYQQRAKELTAQRQLLLEAAKNLSFVAEVALSGPGADTDTDTDSEGNN